MNTIVRIDAPRQITMMKTDIPETPQGHALLRLHYGGICGSDLGTYKGTFLYAKYPRIPGHELSAEIVEVGENPYGLHPGMLVTCNPYFNCGQCYSCRRGFVNCCTDNQTMGAQREGGFSTYFTMPTDRVYDAKGLDAKTLTLVEPLCISYHAVKRADVKPGERVLVVGAGTIGFMAAKIAVMAGAHVVMSDVSRYKLDHAQKLLPLAGTILTTSVENFESNAKELTQGQGFDVCVEAVGLPSTFLNCIHAAAFRGRIVIVGIGKQSLDFFYSIIQTKELDIFGSRNALKGDFEEVISLLVNRKFDLRGVISAVYPVKQVAQAFEDLAENSDFLKVLVDFSHEYCSNK